MRIPIVFLFCVASLLAYSQKTVNAKKIEKLTVTGNAKIVVGEIIINQTIETKVYAVGVEQFKDTSGKYITAYKFGNKEKLPLFAVAIALEFDTPLINWELGGIAMGVSEDISTDKKSFKITANQFNRGFDPSSKEVFRITVVTEKQPHVKIYGIDGKL